MDQKLQTTFIPRKSVVDGAMPRRANVGVFTLISIGLFIVAVALSGGLFFYKQTLASQNTDLKKQLDAYNAKVDSSAVDSPIVKLLSVNTRLTVAKERLNNHLAVSSLLNLLSEVTLQNVRWNSFAFEIADTGLVTLSLTGQAQNFAAVALQEDKISSDSRFRNPLFSNLSLDGNGNPVFSFKTELNPSVVSYEAGVNVSQTQ